MIMLSFSSNCTTAEQQLPHEDAFIDYVETQIGNQETPTSSISTIINLCKTPIKKNSEQKSEATANEIKLTTILVCQFEKAKKETSPLAFSSTDIIYPFNYFW